VDSPARLSQVQGSSIRYKVRLSSTGPSAVWPCREHGRGRSGTGGQIGRNPAAVFEGHRDGEVRRWRSTLDDNTDAPIGIRGRR
jgi:hypothetical protein